VIRRSQVYTIADYLDQRYDARIKTIYSIFVIFLIVFVDMAASLYAGGILLKSFIPGLPLAIIILIVMGLTAIYSLVGGLWAISRTGIIQSFVIFFAAVLIAYFSLMGAGGWAEIKATAPEEYLTLIRPADAKFVPWTGLLIGLPILSAYFWLTNPNMAQWVLSARSVKDARRGLILAGMLKLSVLFLIVLPGVAAFLLLPGLSDYDLAYPELMRSLLPSGILGLVLGGFFAALMSNTEATLHAASTIITMDFISPKKPHLSPRSLVWAGRGVTIIIIALSAIWAPQIGRFANLFEYIQGLLSYAVAPIVVVYLAGIFWPRATASGAFWSFLIGGGAAVTMGICQSLSIIDIHYLHVPLPITLISLLTLSVISLNRAAPDVKDSLLWKSTAFEGLTRQDIILALILLGLTTAQVIVFR
ncbi:MAG: sodium/solute symporter, partial [Hellea sp.]|nr:sodium/solute symporter [Hellea sp.]